MKLTIQLASLQARVNDRASRLFAEGYTATQKDEVTYLVRNEEGTAYEVCTIFDSCTCPFYKQNGFCKHFYGLKELLSTQQAYEDAQVAQLEAEHEMMENGEGYFSTNLGGVLW